MYRENLFRCRSSLCVVFALAAVANSFGPGKGPWVTGVPEQHGLNSTLLGMASKNMDRVPGRTCLLVVKDGEIMLEDYYNSTSTSAYETDSLAKTATALVVGAAIYAGLFTLDTPIAEYGVPPTCFADSPNCWELKCANISICPDLGPNGYYYKNVTARTLLAQSSGCSENKCTAAPGTAWTYDSGQYIQHLSLLIAVTSKQPSLQWATQNLLSKIGLPNFYVEGDGYPGDDHDPDFTAGGGMLANCRDVARLAQIVLDKGVVKHTNGSLERVIGEDYINEIFTPQFPHRGYTYGLLTWLNVERNKSQSPECCAPRWGPPSTCIGNNITTPLLGDGIADVAPHDIGIAMGWLGQYLYMIPSRNMSIVTMGSTWGSSISCSLGNALPTDPVYNDGYDDAFTATQVWLVVGDATKPHSNRSLEHTTDRDSTHNTNGTTHHNIQHNTNHNTHHTTHHTTTAAAASTPPTRQNLTTRRGESGVDSEVDTAASASGVRKPDTPVATKTTRTTTKATSTKSTKTKTTTTTATTTTTKGYGSCTCRCPPGRLTGFCYDLTAPPKGTTSVEQCSSVLNLARDCGVTGVVRECHRETTHADENCTAAGHSMRGDIGSMSVWGGHLQCSLTRPCSSDKEGSPFYSAACTCQPVRYGDFGCTYSTDTCVYSGYIAPGTQPL